MISVIGKRIENDSSLAGGQKGYAKSLISYMGNPVAKDARTEKCIATMSRNFSVDNPSPKRMAAEMAADCSLCKGLTQGSHQALEHWVISFKRTDDEFIPPEKIFKAVEGWISDMGYGESFAHKWNAAIHDDTENLHCHIAICRVNALTGKVRKRGWWKNDNQKALARMARENGWHLENEAKFVCPSAFEINEIVQRDTVTDNVALAKRPRLVDVSTGKTVLDDVALPALRVKNRRGGTSILPITPDIAEKVAPELAEYERMIKQQTMRTEPDKITPVQSQDKVAGIPRSRHKSGNLGVRISGSPPDDDLGFWDLVEALGAGVCEIADHMIEIEPITDDDKELSIIKITGKSWSKGTKRLLDTQDLPPQLQSIIDKNTQYLQPHPSQPETRLRKVLAPSFAASEAHRGTKSAETILRERLSEAYAQMETRLPRMKWGQIHKELAQYGVEMKRREHGTRYGIVFSIDGKNWSKASDVFPKMSWQAMNGHIGAKADSWRDAKWCRQLTK